MVVCPLGMHRIPPFLIALPERTTLSVEIGERGEFLLATYKLVP